MEEVDSGMDLDEDEVSYLDLGNIMNRFTRPAVNSAIDTLELKHGSRGLDAGCGIGNHTLWLAEAVAPEGHVTGVDISEEALSIAKEKQESSNLKKQVSFEMGDIFNLPFEDGTFDWIWSADVLYLWLMGSKESPVNPKTVIKELARVTKPGGKIGLFLWSSQKLLPGYPLLEARLNATKAANFAPPHGISPKLHSTRALGWFQEADLGEPKVKDFVVEFQAPFSDEEREALMGTFKMFWNKAKSEVSDEVWAEYKRLCNPKSQDFILNLKDYHGYFIYSLFYAVVK
jgi:demethylmenaquinone methyltransferase/2-methoxy-6-polyprenyl-1,4-benzoquinol methylase